MEEKKTNWRVQNKAVIRRERYLDDEEISLKK